MAHEAEVESSSSGVRPLPEGKGVKVAQQLAGIAREGVPHRQGGPRAVHVPVEIHEPIPGVPHADVERDPMVRSVEAQGRLVREVEVVPRGVLVLFEVDEDGVDVRPGVSVVAPRLDKAGDGARVDAIAEKEHAHGQPPVPLQLAVGEKVARLPRRPLGHGREVLLHLPSVHRDHLVENSRRHARFNTLGLVPVPP